MDTSRNDLLGELAADAALERQDFLVRSAEQLHRFLDANRDRISELGGLTLIDEDPDYLSIAPDLTFRSRTRFQDETTGDWVSETEVERIVSFWRNAKPPETTDDRRPTTVGQNREPRSENQENSDAAQRTTPNTQHAPGLAEFLSVDEQDELLPEAIKLVKQHQRASASLLQRRLRIGYSKAAQLIDLLEQQGIVGPAEDGRSREVLEQG